MEEALLSVSNLRPGAGRTRPRRIRLRGQRQGNDPIPSFGTCAGEADRAHRETSRATRGATPAREDRSAAIDRQEDGEENREVALRQASADDEVDRQATAGEESGQAPTA